MADIADDSNIQVLVVEDETAIADTVVYALRTDRMHATHVTLGRDALALLQSTPFHLAIVDVNLPDISGFDLCREMRRFSDVPVIFLTARADEIDRIVGLEIGADDYVTKPFSPRELATRVRVILRRTTSRKRPDSLGMTEPEGRFRVDQGAQRIYFADQPLELTRYEYHLMRTFLEHPKRIFSREDLMQRIWVAPDHSMERTVDAHVKTVRAKLREVLGGADPIETHRGLGYSWEFAV